MTLDKRTKKCCFKHILLIFTALIILLSLTGSVSAFGAGGDGSVTDPFQIATPEHLQEIGINGSTLDSYFILNNDITLTAPWTPLGSSASPFTGSLDGNGSTIFGLEINTASNGAGLFGFTDGASITNLTIDSATISGASEVGTVAGFANNTTFDNIAVIGGTVDGSGGRLGGLVGQMQYGSLISNSYAEADIKGSGHAGGLVGYMSDADSMEKGSRIINSHAAGSVTAVGVTGGLVGEMSYNGSIINSFATGNVNGGDQTGGLVGTMTNSEISYSYTTGDVNGYRWVGGLVGLMSQSKILNSFATGIVIGVDSIDYGGSTGGLVGSMFESEVSNSYFTGNVGGYHVGGLVGGMWGSKISNSFVTGNVEGYSRAGGLTCDMAEGGYILNSFVAGNVKGSSVGGLVAHLDDGKISNSFVTGNIEATGSWGSAGGLVGFINSGTIQNSMALSKFINGDNNMAWYGISVYQDIVWLGAGTADNLFVWNNTTNAVNTTTPITSQTDATRVDCQDVWGTFPTNPIWATFDTADWTLNSHSEFRLPVPTWTIDPNLGYANVIANAMHLYYEPPNGGSGSGGGGSGTGNATVTDPGAGGNETRPPVVPEPPEVPEPPAAPETPEIPPEMPLIVILFPLLGVAAFAYRNVEGTKEKNFKK